MQSWGVQSPPNDLWQGQSFAWKTSLFTILDHFTCIGSHWVHRKATCIYIWQRIYPKLTTSQCHLNRSLFKTFFPEVPLYISLWNIKIKCLSTPDKCPFAGMGSRWAIQKRHLTKGVSAISIKESIGIPQCPQTFHFCDIFLFITNVLNNFMDSHWAVHKDADTHGKRLADNMGGK